MIDGITKEPNLRDKMIAERCAQIAIEFFEGTKPALSMSGVVGRSEQLCAVNFRTMNWIEYNKQKPKIGQLVLIYRDIESKQIYSTVWSDEDERFADWNEITHWMPLEYPSV